MARPFQPSWRLASEAEHVLGKWVHPKVTGRAEGYANNEIIIAIAGKVTEHGGKKHGAGGVYSGPGNEDWNKHVNFTYEGVKSQETQLAAAFEAIDVARSFPGMIILLRANPAIAAALGPLPTINGLPGSDLFAVTFKTDSKFLAEVMDVAFSRGEVGDWKLSDGTPVDDKAAVQRLRSKMSELHQMGVRPYLWHVSEEENAEAHEIADRAHTVPPT